MDKYTKFMSKFLSAILITLGAFIVGLVLFMFGYAIYKAISVLYFGRPL